MAHDSILDLLLGAAGDHPERTAAMVKRAGAYQPVRWGELRDAAARIGAGLLALGVQARDRVALISNTRLEWVTADLGIAWAGAATVAIYPSNLADECQFILQDSGAVVVIAEDARQVEKLRAERARLPGVRQVVCIEGAGPQGAAAASPDGWVISLDELMARGEGARAALDDRRAGLARDSLRTLIYTSGTTGRPKGVMLTHGGLLTLADAIVEVDLVRPGDVQLLFLPLAHSFAQLLLLGWLATRHVLAFAESLDTVRENVREVRPTLMAAVPRFFEKVHAAVVQRALSQGLVERSLFRAAMAASERHGRAVMEGRRLPAAEALRYRALRRTVFRSLGRRMQQALGGRMRAMGSGGAPIAPALLWFFADAGLSIYEGYGLTETAAGGALNRPGQQRIGTVGRVIPGMELRLADDGEILLRGPNVMVGYWNRPEETAEVLDADGWLHTGDLGEIDADGYLRITDRKKDLIITAGGKNVAPQRIENELKRHELISQVVVHGDRRPYLTALITLDAEALARLCAVRGLGNGAYAVMSQRPEVVEEVGRVVADLNARLPSFETIKRFKILEHDFSQEGGELTPTLKVRRKVIAQRYAAALDALYGEGA